MFMKNIRKGIIGVLLTGMLSLSGALMPGVGVKDVQAETKLVTQKSLPAMTNVKYDAEDNRLTWDKVPGANKYVFRYSKNDNSTTRGSTSNLYTSFSGTGGPYTLTIYAQNDSEEYLVAENIAYTYSSLKNYEYDTAVPNKDGTCNLYKYVSGPVTTLTITEMNPHGSSNSTAVSQAPKLQIKDRTEASVSIKPETKPRLNYGEKLYWEYANNSQFKNSAAKGWEAYSTTQNYSASSFGLTVYYSSFHSGDTIYVRARVYNSYYNYKTSENEKYSAYSPTVTFTVPVCKISNVHVSATASSVVINTNVTSGVTPTGYQFAKKVGSKWVTLSTQTDDVYEDKGLTKNTNYKYRVRAYYYNKYTKKTLWTPWTPAEATTWGSNMNLKLDAASATSVKLSWTPVAGAEGYEIYRVTTDSYARNDQKGVNIESFSDYTLIKTIKKGKAKTYTDKGLSKNGYYYYLIRAYKTIGKQKVFIQKTAYIYLKPGAISVTETYVDAKGRTVVKWKKQSGLKGYYVEKQDPVTNEYTVIKTLKASANSYTFPRPANGSDSVNYRIRPFDATTTYSGHTATVYAKLAAPKNVKVKKTANGVQVTWSSVPGADYYQVYRTTSNDYIYYKTSKDHSTPSYNRQVYEGYVNTTGCHPELGEKGYNEHGTYKTVMITSTSVEDKALTYQACVTDANGDPVEVGKTADGKTLYQTEEFFYENIQGPEAGNTYYYYVEACSRESDGSYTSSPFSKFVKITYTNKAAKKVSKITSVKSKKKGQATVSFKKVKGVDGYAIYRATKKNAGKTVYYKVASYVKGETKANIYSAKTAAKSVKVRK